MALLNTMFGSALNCIMRWVYIEGSDKLWKSGTLICEIRSPHNMYGTVEIDVVVPEELNEFLRQF